MALIGERVELNDCGVFVRNEQILRPYKLAELISLGSRRAKVYALVHLDEN